MNLNYCILDQSFFPQLNYLKEFSVEENSKPLGGTLGKLGVPLGRTNVLPQLVIFPVPMKSGAVQTKLN